MMFFSGFSLSKEEVLFRPWIDEGDFTVAGFSLGAIEALEYTLHTTKRVDKLQLFSPAFFQDRDMKFKRLQTLHFKKDKKAYVENFLQNIAFPSDIKMQKYYHDSDIKALEKLLNYRWDIKMLEKLRKRSIMIEVYLGEKDKIINTIKAKDFFKQAAVVTWIKGVGHILKEKHG